MRILTKEETLKKKSVLLVELQKKLFIYPTDTVYGIGGNAMDKTVVAKIREIKKSNLQPFSVIAPSKEWIREHCVVTKEAEQWLEKLPGPYTLILPMKKNAVAANVTHGQTLGVRIPDHWFSGIIAELDIPFVTTSANITAEEIMTTLDDLPTTMKQNIDYAIYEGPKKGRPSTLVHLEQKKVVVQER